MNSQRSPQNKKLKTVTMQGQQIQQHGHKKERDKRKPFTLPAKLTIEISVPKQKYRPISKLTLEGGQ